MAMSLKGKRRHYSWSDIQIRLWLSAAAQCQFSETLMQNIMDDVFDTMENVIHQVTDLLPDNFPTQISESIFAGMREVKNQHQK